MILNSLYDTKYVYSLLLHVLRIFCLKFVFGVVQTLLVSMTKLRSLWFMFDNITRFWKRNTSKQYLVQVGQWQILTKVVHLLDKVKIYAFAWWISLKLFQCQFCFVRQFRFVFNFYDSRFALTVPISSGNTDSWNLIALRPLDLQKWR